MQPYFYTCFICTILLFAARPQASGQACPPNIDFEQGNFNNWDCFIGSVSSLGGQNTINLTPSSPTPGRHELIAAGSPQALDFYGGFPRLCPNGGNYSIKLGNDQSSANAEGIAYTFTVPANQDTFTFTYYYAVVFEDPNHQQHQQPRFFVKAYDVLTGDIIDCASYNYVSGSSLPGFQVSPVNNRVLFRPWTPSSIQFSGLANRQVRLEFKTADCTLGVHFGYAYIDVSSNCSNILATAPYCIETNSVVLSAPFGFQSYTWYNSTYTQVVGNQQSITLSPPPPGNSIYHVDMIPYPGYGCRDTAHVTPVPQPVPPLPQGLDAYHYCQFAVSQPPAITASPGHTILWYTQPTGGTGSSQPPLPQTNTIGVVEYYAAQRSPAGCEGPRKKITVTVSPSPVVTLQVTGNCINTPIQMVAGNTGGPVSNWLWHVGNGFTAGAPAITHTYTTPGPKTVMVAGVSAGGCADTATYQFTVYDNSIFAGNDTFALINEPLQIGTGGPPGTQYQWSPSTGLSSDTAARPLATLDRDQLYHLLAITPQGCLRRSSILVTRFKEAGIYVPGAFTPNADGVNDVLLAMTQGVRLHYFKVFNRYGQEMFSTTNAQQGWNGLFRGVQSDAGAYVYTAAGIDFKGRKIFRKGTVLLIR